MVSGGPDGPHWKKPHIRRLGERRTHRGGESEEDHQEHPGQQLGLVLRSLGSRQRFPVRGQHQLRALWWSV